MEAPRAKATRSIRHLYASMSRTASALASPLKTRAEKALLLVQQHREKLRSLILLTALGLFCGGVFLSLKEKPDILEQIELAPLAIVFLVLLPAGMAINTVDFQLLARLSGVQVNFWRAFEVTIYTRAANMLPIPGSMAVRAAALKAGGATFRKSGGLILLFTAIWGGAGFVFSAMWLVGQAPHIVTGSFALVGAAILAACSVVTWRMTLDVPMVIAAAFLRFALIVLEAFVLLMAAQAIGANATYAQMAALVVASFLASAVPAGIGVKESLLAMFAPIVGISSATGFLAGAMARLAATLLLALCTAGAVIHRHLRFSVWRT